ncbi:MAG TPA: hypothetical protein PKN95_10950 [Verrucomicrobiota bacterium]|nr:hypothetical protein [Verrucomicrobiota bacterium]HNT14312.1 hypothetical protein [Verrucomicrobiota bacterium]
MSVATRHCWKCGAEYPERRSPGRSETCLCGADLKVCLNCAHYDRTVAYQCRERRAEPVMDKDVANYCEWFELARRVYMAPAEAQFRADRARDQLKRLLGGTDPGS